MQVVLRANEPHIIISRANIDDDKWADSSFDDVLVTDDS
jgi:hypothetical protein